MAIFRERSLREWARIGGYGLLILAGILVGVVLLHALLFGPPEESNRNVAEFLVTPNTSVIELSKELKAAGYIKQAWIFYITYAVVHGETTVRPGGYRLSRSMDAWIVSSVLGQAPYLAWVTIPAGLRKEEVGELLTETLVWNDVQIRQWHEATSATSSDILSEGVYFPDTYLIPSDQSPLQIAERLRDRFEEGVSQYVIEAYEKEQSWNDVVILASLIEKEAGKRDKALVAGILSNRLKRGMMLQVDATLQYVTGTSERGWWRSPKSEDKYVESPFNTYQHTGLPPEPIATPSLDSIVAALNPEKTTCLYYLHDDYGRIHCSTNYKSHVANVQRYLR